MWRLALLAAAAEAGVRLTGFNGGSCQESTMSWGDSGITGMSNPQLAVDGQCVAAQVVLRDGGANDAQQHEHPRGFKDSEHDPRPSPLGSGMYNRFASRLRAASSSSCGRLVAPIISSCSSFEVVAPSS